MTIYERLNELDDNQSNEYGILPLSYVALGCAR